MVKCAKEGEKQCIAPCPVLSLSLPLYLSLYVSLCLSFSSLPFSDMHGQQAQLWGSPNFLSQDFWLRPSNRGWETGFLLLQALTGRSAAPLKNSTGNNFLEYAREFPEIISNAGVTFGENPNFQCFTGNFSGSERWATWWHAFPVSCCAPHFLTISMLTATLADTPCAFGFTLASNVEAFASIGPELTKMKKLKLSILTWVCLLLFFEPQNQKMLRIFLSTPSPTSGLKAPLAICGVYQGWAHCQDHPFAEGTFTECVGTFAGTLVNAREVLVTMAMQVWGGVRVLFGPCFPCWSFN